LEPFGEWRDDYRIAQLCALLVNIMKGMFGNQSEKTKPALITDFLLQDRLDRQLEDDSIEDDGEQQRPMQSIEEMKQILIGIARYQKKAKSIQKHRRKK
jgi:hypothetical protein